MKSKTSTQTPSNIVLAIDPGFDRMGVAVLVKESGKEKILFSDCITTDSKAARGKRLLQIGESLREIISEWSPRDMAIETLYFNQNTSSAIGVAEARGVAIYEAERAGLSVHEYSPQDVKIAVTGYGKATKRSVEMMVKKLVMMNDVKRLDDELDAVAIGITHLSTTRH